ncbi:hypothetical protein [Symbiopectobacterium sp.]|uniref:hypothetical protein n=1 Tax=Symbiopectobacterium sp. TaxID=2952789 RepID=UPI003F2E53E7
MTKHEKQQLELVCRYMNDGFADLGCGRISFGVASVEQAKILLDVLLAMANRKLKQDK